MNTRRAVAIGVFALVVAACGGGRTAPTVAGGGTDAPGGGGGGDAVAIAEGKAIFDASCVACHAPGGVGVEGLGKPMVGSEFIASLSDSELVQFITVGRDSSDPLNTSGIGMPAKGGNPSLTEDQLGFVVAYLRSIN